jgi:hypothetical protein
VCRVSSQSGAANHPRRHGAFGGSVARSTASPEPPI